MTDGTRISLAGHVLTLLPDRAAWWPARRALVVADVHLGKGAHFRAQGFPVPSGGTRLDLARLKSLVESHEALELWILGDLFHTRATDAFHDHFSRWRRSIPRCRVALVRGNHDRDVQLPEAWAIETTDDALVDGIRLVHAPGAQQEQAEIAGHVHPALSLGSRRSDSLRAPVFWLRGQQLVLPAFGSFTGGFSIRPGREDRVFAVGPDTVVEVRHRGARRAS